MMDVCVQADLAHSFNEMKLKMRGGEEVEYEMVACVNRGKVKWDGLRVAGLCIGIDEYTNLDSLHNAVRDAEAVNSALKSVPDCYSAIIRNPKTGTALLESVERHAKEPGLHDDPPEFYELYYAGHAIQNEKDVVYLVPSEAKVDNTRYMVRECVPLSEILLILHDYLDDPVCKKSQRVIHFIIDLDSCRSSTHRNVQATLACEPAPDKCPRKWTVVFSCSRTKPASDGPSGGHSPFARAFLDPHRDFMAEGVSLASAHYNVTNVLSSQTQNQRMKIIGETLPVDFCVRPKKIVAAVEPVVVGAASSSASTAAGGATTATTPKMQDDLMQKLREYDLGHVATNLIQNGFINVKRVRKMTEKHVVALALSPGDAMEFEEMRQELEVVGEQAEKRKQGAALKEDLKCKQETEQNRLKEEAEKKRLKEEAEQKRLKEEAEQKQLKEEAEHKRIREAEQKRQEKAVAAQKSPDELEKDILKMLPTDASDQWKQAIGDIVHNNEEKINLGSNNPLHVERRQKISDEDAKALAEALKVNTALQELYLEHTDISAEGVKALAEALKVNTTLQRLCLSCNKIFTSEEGAKALAEALAEALKFNTALQRLDLNFNNISDKGVSSEIQSYLERNRLSKAISDVEHNKMEELNLCDKNISEEGGMRIRMMRKVSFCPQRPWTLPGLPCVSIRWGTMCW